jgi:hypothetical protein
MASPLCPDVERTPKVGQTKGKEMEERCTMEDTGIMNLYHRGVKEESICTAPLILYLTHYKKALILPIIAKLLYLQNLTHIII